MRGIHQRTLGIHNALREAAASDPALAATLRAHEERRRASVENWLATVIIRLFQEDGRKPS